ncbi:DDE-type integrase/transposase/recombinase [Staphylococcus chromogenes]|uniref:DDE-type integrase/transposase/recombinase n=1 Tax=Staphylococcus chromogenes TaxID=46126 RepID=UPI0039918509
MTDLNIMSTNTKHYLSPILDVFLKEIIAYFISNNPTLGLVLSSLDKAIRNIPKLNYRTTVHSDQGWHYQLRPWVEILKNHIFFKVCQGKVIVMIIMVLLQS